MWLMLKLPCRGLWEFKTSVVSCQGHACYMFCSLPRPPLSKYMLSMRRECSTAKL